LEPRTTGDSPKAAQTPNHSLKNVEPVAQIPTFVRP
jgi:hypothetical protein